jgi:putative radical SAM enzyme (TIGR03279 family)
MRQEITEILPGSIAHALENTPGDFLLQINEKKIIDVFDYKFTVQNENLFLEIEKPNGEIWELEIEKDPEEDLGLAFKHPLMSKKRRCRNKCIFCFIDQQPPGLRPSLYIKDDDARLSFLHGNYVTLTNVSREEISRLASYHLSPLRISVHAADLDLRKKIMGNENAANLFEALKIFADAGIKMHFQVVLCKGFNDGENLSHTIDVLKSQKGAESLAIVPAGLTKHRENLHPLNQFTSKEAAAVIAQIESRGKNFVFASDEWYIMAEKELPPYKYYGDFPQLDNGVGMLRLFEQEFLSAMKTSPPPPEKPQTHIGIVTGTAAAKFMEALAKKYENANPGTKIKIYPINNNFLGKNITVSGLLTGTDIISQLQNEIPPAVIFIPQNAFRASTETMLDGTTLKQLSKKLNIPAKIGSADGGQFYKQLAGCVTIRKRSKK